VNRPEGGFTTEFQNWFVLKEIIICIIYTHTCVRVWRHRYSTINTLY
jgi:hypothetical protein